MTRCTHIVMLYLAQVLQGEMAVRSAEQIARGEVGQPPQRPV